MKIKKEDNKGGFETTIILSDFFEHPEMYTNTKDGKPVIERIELSYAPSVNKFYISAFTAYPSDSYGCDWYISDNTCHSLEPEELDELINQLQLLKKQTKGKG